MANNKVRVKIPLEDEWKQWMNVSLSLKNDTINKSYAGSYMTHIVEQMVYKIQNTSEVQNVLGGKTLLSDVLPILLKSNPQEAINLLYRLLCEWVSNHGVYSSVSDKTANNYASALVCYIRFLMDIDASGQLPALVVNVNGKISVSKLTTALHKVLHAPQVYPLNIVKKVFKLRICTQDRFPVACAYLPIRLLKKIFYSTPDDKRWFDNWLEQLVCDIKLVTSKSIINLRKVEYLEIEGPEVWVKIKDNPKKYRVLTFTVSKNRSNPDAMKASKMSDISIDHDTPISQVLCNGNWLGLTDLSGLIDVWRKETKGASGWTLPKQASEIAKDLPDRTLMMTDIIKRLQTDLKCIAKGGLSLMERGENSKKNDEGQKYTK